MLCLGVCVRRFLRPVQYIAFYGAHLRGSKVVGKRRHAELPQCPAQNNLLKHLVHGRIGVAQVRHEPAAHYVAPVAARAKRGKQIRSIVDLALGYGKLEGRRGNGLSGLFDGFERCASPDRKDNQSAGPDLSFADGPIGKRRGPTLSGHHRDVLRSVHRVGHRRRRNPYAGVKFPEGFAVGGSIGDKFSVRLFRETPDFPRSSAFRRFSRKAGPHATLRGGQPDPRRSGVPWTRS